MNLSGVDLNLLVVLDALLSTRSVTATARKVGLSQPAVSHALGRLRALFGDPLLVRAGSRLVPTARAEALRTPLAGALDMVRRTLAGPVAFDPERSERTFTVWMPDLGGFVVVPALAGHLAANAPHVDVVVRAGPIEDVERLLVEGGLDLAIGVFDGERPQLHWEKLYDETFVCVMRKSHPALRRPWTLDAFCALPHLLVAPRGTPGSIVDTRLGELGKRRRVALTVPHFLVAPHVVAASDLVWTAPERMARAYASLLGLSLRPAPVPVRGFTTVMVWHTRHVGDEGHAWLREVVRGTVAA
jgi:DNA-binding transcriptional LysR family regulator